MTGIEWAQDRQEALLRSDHPSVQVKVVDPEAEREMEMNSHLNLRH